ncbi:MAG: carboxylating nicotinate-nucleotide diphosphorylase [Chloroflexi bacterium]|nr:carboxylating nicotinate-nucleotide diphosphorylase [Chloroflexota bacterium]
MTIATPIPVATSILGAPPDLTEDIDRWLAEDVGDGDRTTESVVPVGTRVAGVLLVKEPGVVAGLDLARQVFQRLDPGLRWEAIADDGTRLDGTRTEVARFEASARAVLTGERLALNLLGRLSGIATLTARYVAAVADTRAVILDTRKTTPGLRVAEKWAVRCGGATNHRMGLHDGVLIKDNHLLFVADLATAVERARAAGLPVEVECDTLDQVRQALAVGADRILLDNMTLDELRAAVVLTDGRVPLEASGGVTIDTVGDIARTGVDHISVGALTHAARSLDVSLEVRP